MKKLILGITCGVSFVAFLILLAVTRHMTSSLVDQNMAERWSEKGDVAHISCFFSADASITEDTLQEFEYELENFLQESSITQDSENPGARLWTSAYSAEGKITLTSEYGSLEADAIGAGGDFFLFHPQQLLYGAYFSGNDLNHDYCVIDEDAAWQLFGSNNVAGMMVNIGGIPHIVTGVVERPKGSLWEAAGLDTTRVYVSISTLQNHGVSHGINHYEIVMPNPVKEFALKHVTEKLGKDEKETEILENNSRFDLIKRLEIIKAFGTRSMSGKSIVYPYWENLARGYEDIVGMLTVIMILTFLYPTGAMVLVCVRLWRHKDWTIRSICLKIVDRIECFWEKRYSQKPKEEDL